VERPGLFKTVSAVVVFAAAFLAVSNYLGGGIDGVAAASLIAVAAAIAYFVFYGWIAKETLTPPSKRPHARPESKADITSPRVRRVQSVCEPGPHDVEAGRLTQIALEVNPGDTVVGRLEEEDGDDFEWMIVDEDNWVKYVDRGRCDVEAQGRGRGAYTVRWRVSGRGPWFLVLEAYGKKNVREVWTNLRRE